MALKKRFREAARNEFRFFFFCSVISGLDDFYYCSNIIVSLLFKLCSKFSLRLQERSKVGACCSETDSVCLTEKFAINHQIIYLMWIFLKACSIQLDFRRLFKVFWFDLQKYLEKIPLYLLFCFSQLLPRFFISQFCNPSACFFFAKIFGQARETVDLPGNIYLQ